MTPAVKAGTPEDESSYEQTEIEGVPFYIHNNFAQKQVEIDWSGFWIFGQYTVSEV